MPHEDFDYLLSVGAKLSIIKYNNDEIFYLLKSIYIGLVLSKVNWS